MVYTIRPIKDQILAINLCISVSKFIVGIELSFFFDLGSTEYSVCLPITTCIKCKL